MESKLRIALLIKEKAELFLNILEKLRNEKAINDVSYGVLKTAYLDNLQNAQIKIEQIKQELNKGLAMRARQLGTPKQELANLDALFKEGQIAANKYQRLSKAPQKKASALEDEIAHLDSLTNCKHSSEVAPAGPSNLLSLLASKLRPEKRPADISPGRQGRTPSTQPEQTRSNSEQVKLPDASSVSNLLVLPDRAYPGSSIGVIATIVNPGQEPLHHKAEFKINGRVVAVNEILLKPGQSEEVTFMTVAGAPGDYNVAVDNAAGILRILPPA